MNSASHGDAVQAAWRARGALPWYCHHCPKLLGFILGDRFLTYHGRREIDVTISVARQVCNHCGQPNCWIIGEGPIDVRTNPERAELALVREQGSAALSHMRAYQPLHDEEHARSRRG